MAHRPRLEMQSILPDPTPPAVDRQPAPAPAPKQRTPARVGKRGISFWVPPYVWQQLGRITLDENRSVQSLMEEATDLLFHSRGLHRCAWDGNTGPGEAGDRG